MNSLKALQVQEVEARVCPKCLGTGKHKAKNKYLDACTLCAENAELEYQLLLSGVRKGEEGSK